MNDIPRSLAARWRLPTFIGLPSLAALSLPMLLAAPRPIPQNPVATPQGSPQAVAFPAHAGRLNQSPDNLDKGIAIPADLALKKGGKDKIAFLTFDDGPSPITARVLATLKKNDVKATFFVIGSMAKQYPEMLKKEFEAGHAIANHSYTHIYSRVYRTPWTMIAEIQKTEGVLEEILGPTFRTKVFRFPGGYMGVRSCFHGHKKRYALALKDCGMEWIDWNVYDGDAEPRPHSSSQLVSTVLSEARGQNRIVVLMHDAASKSRTAAALPRIIAGLKKRGYVFRTLE